MLYWECTQREDEDRALPDTWVMDEIRLAVEKGYRILEIYEVYEYQITQYSPENGEGGHFVEYKNTFLKCTQHFIAECCLICSTNLSLSCQHSMQCVCCSIISGNLGQRHDI